MVMDKSSSPLIFLVFKRQGANPAQLPPAPDSQPAVSNTEAFSGGAPTWVAEQGSNPPTALTEPLNEKRGVHPEGHTPKTTVQ